MKRFGTIYSLLLSISAAILFVAGCNSATEPVPDNNGDDPTNPNSPSANQQITSENIFGDPEKKSTVWDMDGNQTDGFYFSGRNDHVLSAGLLTGSGTSVWQRPVDFQPRDIVNVQTDRFAGAIVVGALDSDGDGLKDKGIASLIDFDGTIQDQLAVDASAPTWFNAVTSVSDTLFLFVGGAAVHDIYYPVLSVLSLGADATLQTVSSTILNLLPGNYFSDVEIDVTITNVDTGQIAVDCYVNGIQESGEGRNITLRRLRCPTDDLANTELVWSKDIVAYTGLNTSVNSGNSLVLANNGMLYIAGKTDVNKDPAPASGGYWLGGLIASVSAAGQVNWVKPIVLSQYNDYYSCVLVTDKGLYAAGRYSSFAKSVTGRAFGYGLLSKFDMTTGDTVYDLSLGDEQYSSGFNTLHVEGSAASAGGWTHKYTRDGSYQSWFAEIDLSKPPLVSSASDPTGGEQAAAISDDDCSPAGGR